MAHSSAHALTYPQGAHAPFTCVQMCVRVYTYVRTVRMYTAVIIHLAVCILTF